MKRIGLVLAALAMAGCGPSPSTFHVRSEGADMPIAVQGNMASGKLLLFIHGGPGGTSIARIGARAFTRLERSAGIAYWDQRAAGNAQGNVRPESLALDRYVGDLDLVVDVLKQRHPAMQLYLFSHSWGGPVSANYLADSGRQAKVKGWITVDGAYSIPETNRLGREWAIARAHDWASEGKEPELTKQALAWYEAHPAIDPTNFQQHIQFVRKLGGYIADPQKAEAPDRLGLVFAHPYAFMSDVFNNGYTVSNFTLDRLLKVDTLPALARVSVPTLMVSGRLDGAVPVGMAEQAFARLGTPAEQKTLRLFDASAHDPMREEPDAFAEAVEQFLR